MNRYELTGRLLAIPSEIHRAEANAIDANTSLVIAKDALADREAALLLEVDADGNPRVNGKNAEQRAAQLRQATELERAAALQAEVDRAAANSALTRLRDEFRAYRACALLLSADDDLRIAA